MKKIIVPIEKGKQSVLDVEDSEEESDVSSSSEDENNNNNEKEEKYDDEFDAYREKEKNEHIKDEDLETQPSKKYLPPSYSKGSRHKGRYTSTWVQYEDSGLGYAYGGADPLNYNPTTKNRFIRRVFTILCIMLFITSGFNFVSSKTDLGSLFKENSSTFIVVPVAIVLLFLNIFMACSECTRAPPFSYVCLFLTLIGTCIVSGFISGRYNTLLIMYVYTTAAFVSLAFIIIANTSYNFLHWTFHIIGAGVALPFILGFFLIAQFRVIEHVRPAYPTYVLIIMVVGALVNVFILTGMLQIILGSQAVDILEDDYTVGAFYLYTSIFDIFIKMIQLLLSLFDRNED